MEGISKKRKKKRWEMINSDGSGILRKANSFPLIASLQHLTQHLQRNSPSPERSLRVFFSGARACTINPQHIPFLVLREEHQNVSARRALLIALCELGDNFCLKPQCLRAHPGLGRAGINEAAASEGAVGEKK